MKGNDRMQITDYKKGSLQTTEEELKGNTNHKNTYIDTFVGKMKFKDQLCQIINLANSIYSTDCYKHINKWMVGRWLQNLEYSSRYPTF